VNEKMRFLEHDTVRMAKSYRRFGTAGYFRLQEE